VTKESKSIRHLLTRELLAVLFVTSLTNLCGEILAPILPLYLRDGGIDARMIGLMFSVMTVGIAISEVFWGWLVDRVDLKLAIFMGTVLYGIMITGLHFANSIPLLFVAFFIYGFSRSPIFIVGRWYMSVYAPPDMKAVAMGIQGTAIAATQMVGGFSSGFIAKAWGFDVPLWLASGLAISGGLFLLVIGRWLNFQNHKQPSREGNPAVKPSPVVVGRDTKLYTLFLGVLGTLFFIAFGVVMTYLPLFAAEVLGNDTAKIGALFGMRGIVAVLFQIPLGRIADRGGKGRFLAIGLALGALAMAGIALSSSFALLVVSVLLLSFGASFYFPTVTAMLSERIPVSWTGTAMGIYGLMEDIGWIIGPAVGGLLWTSVWGIRSPFALGAIVLVFAVVLLQAGVHRVEPKVAAAAISGANLRDAGGS
jgi:MFS family permease